MAQEINSANKVAQNIQDAIHKLQLYDEEGKALKVRDIRYLESNRIKIYGQSSESIVDGDHILAVECMKKSISDDAKTDDIKLTEKIVAIDADNDNDEDIDDDDIEIVEIEDKILMMEMSPCLLVEYTFYDDNGAWFLSPISLPSLEGYRRSKFKNWQQMIENPSCKAAFKRLLNIGLITNIFDHEVFKSPENELKDWMVKDDHGRDVKIPRPVQGLRIWDIKQRKYKSVTPHLEGAPNANEAEKYWENMVDEFKKKMGEEMINDLLTSFKKKKENEKQGENENENKDEENGGNDENEMNLVEDKEKKMINKIKNKYIGKKRKEMETTDDNIDEIATIEPPLKKIKTSH